jgi:hypothetical protein
MDVFEQAPREAAQLGLGRLLTQTSVNVGRPEGWSTEGPRNRAGERVGTHVPWLARIGRLEQAGEALASLGMEPCNVCDTASEMSAEVGNRRTVLAVRALANTVAHDGLETVVFAPRYVRLWSKATTAGQTKGGPLAPSRHVRK